MSRAPLLVALLVLAGCAAPGAPDVRVIDSACQWVKVITVAPDDTAETKRQVLAHDQAVKANCPTSSAGEQP